MSAKSKLKFSLLAATAVFLFNPGLMPKALQSDTALRAQEIQAPGLGELLDSPANAGGKAGSVNAALALPASSADKAAASADTAVAINPHSKPGENPFQSSGSALAPKMAAQAPAVVAVTPAVLVGPAAVSHGPADVAAIATPVSLNPFESQMSHDDTQSADSVSVAPLKVDISALRYYAASKDLKRLGAEMRRLKDLYPDWQPPKDLFSQSVAIDEQPLWTIYARGDFASVRAEIARIQSANPKWQPSEDLIQKLKVGETRALILSATAQGRWRDVLSTAQAVPQIMVCQEMQVQWNVAEAFARLKNYAEAFDVYHYILSTCDDPAMRLATVQKAGLLLPSAGTTSLIALGRPLPDGGTEFEEIGFDGLRHDIGAFIEKGDFATMPQGEDLTRFVEFVQRTSSAKDATLIGWYFYSQKDWTSANAWFIQAAKYQRDPKSIEGVILTLRNMDRHADALQMARRYMTASPDIAKQYIEIVSGALTQDKASLKLEKDDADTFEKVVAEQKSALGGQALGWKYLASGDKAIAQKWFSDSVSWEPTEGGVIGLAVLASRAKNYATLTALKIKYASEFEGLRDFRVYKPRPARVASTRPVKVKKVEEKKGFFWFSKTNG
ncbi:hypothetical protein BJF93_20715 [Xaviernesmea oryzae]|uniref:Tetratricopeptide repeat protein n=1 Tax=Xaviernesmea oryzae TaxID=464029 RepID=A0A1Q9AZQ7_9HYPH|nr:hypothetical protein [Xaviernesmea oryzae]OLP61217.1 hypothetical protein BJF93_20715 [Xaviernesmea oryzae]SEL50667.1 hypothetical protein SAMN04487976_10919 [Xaviernesmea oryzae]